MQGNALSDNRFIMYVHTTTQYVAGVLVAILCIFFSSFSFTHAALITDTQITDQKTEVKDAMITTINEQIKLLQMILITRLEAEVHYLQSIVDAQ